MAQFQFDATQHASAMNFDALPKGWYQALVTESKSRQTTSGGQALDFIAEITAPPFAKGRKVFLGYNVVNSNPEAVRIGYEQLAALSIACGVPQWQQTEQLHNKPFHIKLKIEKAAEGTDYEDRNQPNGYDPINVVRALAVQPSVAPAPGSVPAAAFPGAPAAVAPAPAPAPAAQVPVAPPAAQAAPVAPAAQQAPAAAPAQPWAAAPAQPWTAPAAAAAPAPQPAPVAAEPVKSPEQLAWEAQQAQQAPVVAAAPAPQPAPVQPAPVQAAPEAPAAQPWAQQTAQPVQPAPTAAQAVAAPAEPPHPAQAAVPPWQQPTA